MTILAFPKILSDQCRLHNRYFDMAEQRSNEPYRVVPYTYAPFLPWPWLFGLFFLGWMARG
jgi:hypothetical protein